MKNNTFKNEAIKMTVQNKEGLHLDEELLLKRDLEVFNKAICGYTTDQARKAVCKLSEVLFNMEGHGQNEDDIVGRAIAIAIDAIAIRHGIEMYVDEELFDE